MGCDVHCYIEHKKKDSMYWNGFGGRINPGRWYALFAKLAGVRNYHDETPIVAPRGIPEDMGYEAADDWYLYISDKRDDAEGYCSLEKAKRWEGDGRKIILHDGKPWKVENPDWHTPSWITADELAIVLSKLDLAPDEYQAVLAAMRSLESTDNEVRLVFWFDN